MAYTGGIDKRAMAAGPAAIDAEKQFTIVSIEPDANSRTVKVRFTQIIPFKVLRDHLKVYPSVDITWSESRYDDDGVLTLNVGSVPGDRRLIDGLATTMATIFPSVHVMDIPNTLNSILFATKQPTTQENFVANYAVLSQDKSIHPLLINTMAVTLAPANPCLSILNPDFESGFSLAGGGYIANSWMEWEADPGTVAGFDGTSIVHGGAHSLVPTPFVPLGSPAVNA